LLVAASEEGIVSIIVREGGLAELRSWFPKATLKRDEALQPLVAKVASYIAAPFNRFPLALDLRGTPFQKAVWREVQKIPFGQTSTYSRIAEAIGAPKAIRAVASSCTRCWWSFAVPCHRVVHKGGDAQDANGRRRLRWVEYESRLTR
jgi:AraC family transcriptional regulator of adaptative response/methylated-DNA-[protein]-cysteine methyltransferase